MNPNIRPKIIGQYVRPKGRVSVGFSCFILMNSSITKLKRSQRKRVANCVRNSIQEVPLDWDENRDQESYDSSKFEFLDEFTS